jgi:hypothetical protein
MAKISLSLSIQKTVIMNKTEKQIAQAASKFAKRWEGKGYEKGESQVFWLELLTEVFGIEEPSTFISFEDQVHLDHTSFIDGYIDHTHTMIEQKSLGKDLRAPIKQSDGTLLTPFQQAQRYSAGLPYSKRPRWIVTCNFSTFLVYDMENPNGEPFEIRLADLGKEHYRLRFLVETGSEHLEREMRVSMQAGAIVGKLYDALLKEYKDPTNAESLRSLNVLCVRLVFCLYAEDAGIFGRHDMFHDYLVRYDTMDMRNALIRLFKILNTPLDERDPYLQDDLAAFPFASGGLFEGDIEIPRMNEEIRELLLQHASLDFDWSEISPTIFGAVFESTLNPETRRSSGMHYTSVENIHKVIDPLFLDDLRHQLDDILEEKVVSKRRKRLLDFQQHLASLTFLDPACGSGNFLTETYLSLRRLENRLIRSLYEGESMFIGGEDFVNPVKVDIHQFYGIEINDFAVTVATTALWISESQMLAETERIISHDLEFLPLKSFPNIHEANALRTDWNTIVPKEKLNYIMGNPPFIGYSLQSKSQKEDILSVFLDAKGKPFKTAGKIDYVAGWYYKAAQLMQGTSIHAALVSTNSITQGEQVAAIWKPLKDLFDIKIDFAYRTFRWDSEAAIKAHVHCVIIGFSFQDKKDNKDKLLFDGDQVVKAKHINGYLIDAPDIFVQSTSKPLCNVPSMLNGGKPTEGGHLILTEEEKNELVKANPLAKDLIRPYMMGKDFIQRKPRYCLWLVNVSPSIIKQCSKVFERIEKVREYRLASPKVATKKKAETPMLFDEVRECTTDYVAIPKVSSENRRYIPMDYLSKDIIPGDKLFMIPEASLYHFGVLTSNVHMAWMRAVCGRLKSDYSYSNTIVYNNFPWPDVNEEQRERIAKTAQGILDARALYPDSSLADLYDPVTMPPELLKAHRDNDRAVMAANGFPTSMTEPECVARLFNLYSTLIKQQGQQP